jgi:uncharacterized protein with NAD-binding domain and iron-sulfur cluster
MSARPPRHKRKPIEVAIIGGGCAGIAAAFELSRPEHRGRYHVTVYQQGWRLGGKGASGRGPANRIEEHGLHLWMGFYENAFQLLRECYAELNRDPNQCRFADWRDVFVAEPLIGVAGAAARDPRPNWLVHFPPGDGLPGDPLVDANPFTIASYLIRSATLIRTLLMSVPDPTSASTGTPSDGGPPESPSAEELQSLISRYLKYGLMTTLAGLISGAQLLEWLFKTIALDTAGWLVSFLTEFAKQLSWQFRRLAAEDASLRPVWEIIDLVLAFQRGVINSNLLLDPRGFDSLNDFDTREWLKLNGAANESVHCDMMRGLYDLAMAYEDGDHRKPRMAAGLGLRACLRMFFTYRGAMMWKMQTGMGDAVFAPFYEVLKKRGVAFAFFHRLRKLRLSPRSRDENPYVAALEFDCQAETRQGAEYLPLIDINGLPCWPSLPDYSQLCHGDLLERDAWNFESHWEQRRTGVKILNVHEDFDFVVLAVGLGEIPEVCSSILARDRRWRDMVEKIKTIPTHAFQLWLRQDLETLGWRQLPTTMSGFAKPFDTWADMRQLIHEEDWTIRPRSILYFCGAMRESPSEKYNGDYCRERRETTRGLAIKWLTQHLPNLLPKIVTRTGDFRWELLIDPLETSNSKPKRSEKRFTTQFCTANVNPSDRYVLSVPGSTEYRISPLDCTYDNLTIAGDWTACGLNLGCVESAFISGRLAAQAISGKPALEDITGYDHP